MHTLNSPAALSGHSVGVDDLKVNIIETPRLLLKELNPALLTDLLTNCADADIMKFLGVDEAGLKTEKQHLSEGLTSYRASFRNFLIVEKSSGRVVGRCGFHTWYQAHSRAEVGYKINDEALKRRGYMSEALAAIIEHGFRQMGLNRIEAMVSPSNTPSIKLMEKMGFTREGLMRGHYCKDGRMEDSAVFGLLKAEYEERMGNA